MKVMAEMRHPYVVQFLGLCFLEGSALPVLVMERLDGSLDNLLETSPGLTLRHPTASLRCILGHIMAGKTGPGSGPGKL